MQDAGLFEVSLHDERFLPFERHGAISTWTLSLPREDNALDVAKITDVLMDVRFTARSAIDPTTVRSALKPGTARAILVSVRHTFSEAWYEFFSPTDKTAANQVLHIPLFDGLFPYAFSGHPKMNALALYVLFKEDVGATQVRTTVGPSGGSSSIVQFASAGFGPGSSVTALQGQVPVAQPSPPGAWTLILAEGDVPAVLGVAKDGHTRLDAKKIEDIVMIIEYQIVSDADGVRHSTDRRQDRERSFADRGRNLWILRKRSGPRGERPRSQSSNEAWNAPSCGGVGLVDSSSGSFTLWMSPGSHPMSSKSRPGPPSRSQQW